MGGQQLFCLVRAEPPLSKGGAAKGGGGIPSGLAGAACPGKRVKPLRPASRPPPHRVGRLASDGFAVRERLPLQGSWPSPRGLRGFGTARVQRMPPGTRGPDMSGPYRVTKLRIFRERHPYGRAGADLALQVNFCVVQQGNVLDDGKP